MSRVRRPVSSPRAIRCVARLVGSLLGVPLDVTDPSETEAAPALAGVASLELGATSLHLESPTVPDAWGGGAP